jgi:hypothetical protein
VLTKEVLDRLTGHGCTHTDHGIECQAKGLMYLHTKCHRDAPFFMERAVGVVTLRCCRPDCHGSNSFPGELSNPRGRFGGVNNFFEQDCHPHSAVWASYEHGSGVVKVECYQCKAVVAEIRLAPPAP